MDLYSIPMSQLQRAFEELLEKADAKNDDYCERLSAQLAVMILGAVIQSRLRSGQGSSEQKECNDTQGKDSR